MEETNMWEMVNEFMTLWQKHPQQRFCQLFVNTFGVDPFYITDEDAMETMKRKMGN